MVAVLAAAPAARAEPPAAGRYDYVVRPGDSCIGIALRELGDRSAIDRIHALNPQLGPQPHTLVAGSILRLPRPESDATLSAAQGAVRVKRPAAEVWDPAQRGMDLFRTWRVGARARSSAALTFRDTSQLLMRENTVVIIFGPSSERAAASTATELESGALETRLLAARRLVVRTPSAEASVSLGRAVIAIDPARATLVANHSGAPAAVRGVDADRRARGAAVAVPPGMGTTVAIGQPPTPPRPLPPPPAWRRGSTIFIDLGGAGAAMRAAWAPVAAAAHYRVAIARADGTAVAAVTVPAAITALELHRLPAGRYVARAAAIDERGLEGPASAELPLEVASVDVILPGPPSAPAPAGPAPADPEAGADHTTPTPPRALPVGTRIASPRLVCATTGAAAPELVLADPAVTSITCFDRMAGATPPVAVALTRAPPAPRVAAPPRPAAR
jgi:hypothetical protein